MAETPDELDARRALRQRLEALAAQYPQLTTPKQQQRLDAALNVLCEETIPCPDSPPDGL